MFRDFAERVRQLEDPFVVSHIDADGITSAAIILTALRRLGKSPGFLGIRQLDSVTISDVPRDRDVIFTDLGSGQLEMIDFPCHIIDHHTPLRETPSQLNSHHLGYAQNEACGATLSFSVAQHLGDNDDLAAIAVVGAVGDMMDRRGMRGLNLEVVEKAKKAGVLEEKRGLSFFGRETRPLPVFLSFASSPFLPGLSGREKTCSEFFDSLGIETRDGASLRSYHDLSQGEKESLVTALHLHAISERLSKWEIDSLVKPYYLLPGHRRHTEMRDATEFSTLLNACGRHHEAELGVELAAGDLSLYPKAKKMLAAHRRMLRRGIKQLSDEGAQKMENIQFFSSETIKPTLIGVIVGMGLGSRILDPGKVAIGISPQEGGLKISSRTVRSMVRRGVDLAEAMREASGEVGGEGGGHDIAAGAMIPEKKLDDFLQKVDSIIGVQRGATRPAK